MKRFRVTKISKQIRFKVVWDKPEAKNCFQIQSVKFSFAFMSLLTAPMVKNDHIFVEIYFISLSDTLAQT